jgi:hypothetical protein
MGRPIYNYELSDPDFAWLINNFKENHPEYTFVESSGLPVLFVPSSVPLADVTDAAGEQYPLPQESSSELDDLGENK